MDVNRNWTFCIIGQWFDWNTPVNRPYKFVSSRHVKREKASLPVYMRLVVPNSPAAAILKTEKGLETRLSQESIICVANGLKFEWQMLQITRHSSNEKLHKVTQKKVVGLLFFIYTRRNKPFDWSIVLPTQGIKSSEEHNNWDIQNQSLVVWRDSV